MMHFATFHQNESVCVVFRLNAKWILEATVQLYVKSVQRCKDSNKFALGGIYCHYIKEKADINTADISKT